MLWLLLAAVLGGRALPPPGDDDAPAALLRPAPYTLAVPAVAGYPPANLSVYPIFYAIPAAHIVVDVPRKRKPFSDSIPGARKAYPLSAAGEQAYYDDMRGSFFCVDMMKDGWDALRHYEILASGCAPWFINLSLCPPQALASYPKRLVAAAMRLPGVHAHIALSKVPRGRLVAARLALNGSVFPLPAYRRLVGRLLRYTRRWLTTAALAEYVLRVANKTRRQRGLMLLQTPSGLPFAQAAEYSVCTLLHGLRTVMGPNLVEYPEYRLMYAEYEARENATNQTHTGHPHPPASLRRSQLYGGGFTYAFTLRGSAAVDRTAVRRRIRAHAFDFVLYFLSRADTRDRLLWFEDVRAVYRKADILLVDSFDAYD
eukprot:EG_transcript_16149